MSVKILDMSHPKEEENVNTLVFICNPTSLNAWRFLAVSEARGPVAVIFMSPLSPVVCLRSSLYFLLISLMISGKGFLVAERGRSFDGKVKLRPGSLAAGFDLSLDTVWLAGGLLASEIGVDEPFVEVPFLAPLVAAGGPRFETHCEGAVLTGFEAPPKPGNNSSDCVSNRGAFAFPEEGSSFRFPAAFADIEGAQLGATAGSSVDSRTLEDIG